MHSSYDIDSYSARSAARKLALSQPPPRTTMQRSKSNLRSHTAPMDVTANTSSRSNSAGRSRSFSNDSPTTPMIRLSDVLKTANVPSESTRLSVVEKFITIVDEVPEKYHKAESVFLSKNSIVELRGITQFQQAKSISLAHNCIESFDEVDYLASLPNLQNLSLEYNPISGFPNYRAHVVQRIPSLKVLDNKEITAAERAGVSAAIRKEEVFLNMMFSNECLIAKLRAGIDKIKLHSELRTVMVDRLKATSSVNPAYFPSLDTKKFLHVWNFQSVYSEADRDEIYNKMRQEVRRIRNIRLFGGGSIRDDSPITTNLQLQPSKGSTSKKSKGDSWDICFAEVLLQQQNTIATLLSEIEKESEKALADQQRYLQRDPMSTIYKMREEQNETERKSRTDRDNTVNDFMLTIQSLIDDAHKQSIRNSSIIDRISKDPDDFTFSVAFDNDDLDMQPKASDYQFSSLLERAADLSTEPPPRWQALSAQPQPQRSLQQNPQVYYADKQSDDTPEPNRNPPPAPTSIIGGANTSQHSMFQGQPQPTQLPPQAQRSQNRSLNSTGPSPIKQQPTATSRIPRPSNIKAVAHHSKPTKNESTISQQQVNKQQQQQQQQPKQQQPDHHQQHQLLLEIDRLTDLLVQHEEKMVDIVRQKEALAEERASLKSRLETVEDELASKTDKVELLSQKHDSVNAELEQALTENKQLETALMQTKASLVQVTSESEFIKQKANEYSEELRWMYISEKQLEDAESLRNAHIERRAFHALRRITSALKAERTQVQLFSIVNRSKYLLRAAFQEWKRNAAIRRWRKQLIEKRNRERMEKYWTLWLFYHTTIRLCKQAAQRRAVDAMQRAFSTWRLFVSGSKHYRQLNDRATEFYESQLMRRSLRRWRAHSQCYELDPETELLHTRNAIQIRNRLLCRTAFLSWRRYVVEDVQRCNAQADALNNDINRRILYSTFMQWKISSIQAKKEARQMELAAVHFERNLIVQCLARWAAYIELKRESKARKQRAHTHRLRTLFLGFRSQCKQQIADRLRYEQAQILEKKAIMRRSLRLWVSTIQYERHRRVQVMQAIDHYFNHLRKTVINHWKLFVQEAHKQREQEHAQSTAFLRTVFTTWVDYAKRRRRIKSLLPMVVSLQQQTKTTTLRLYFFAWKAVHNKNQRINEMRVRTERRILRIYFYRWTLDVHRNIKQSFLTIKQHYAQLHHDMEQQGEKATGVDLENLKLIDRLHQLTVELTHAQTELKNKDTQIDELQRIVEDNLILENSLRTEIDRYRGQINEHEAEIARLKGMLSNMEHDTVNTAHTLLELQTAQAALQKLQTAFDEKSREAEILKQTLQSNADEFEQQLSQSQEKLTSAFEIAGSLRKLLEERDSSISELESTNSTQTQKIEELQLRLTTTTMTLSKTVDERNAEINELQTRCADTQRKLTDSISLMIQYQTDLESKNEQLRKLQYEVQLLSQRESQQTANFIRDINHFHYMNTSSSSNPADDKLDSVPDDDKADEQLQRKRPPPLTDVATATRRNSTGSSSSTGESRIHNPETKNTGIQKPTEQQIFTVASPLKKETSAALSQHTTNNRSAVELDAKLLSMSIANRNAEQIPVYQLEDSQSKKLNHSSSSTSGANTPRASNNSSITNLEHLDSILGNMSAIHNNTTHNHSGVLHMRQQQQSQPQQQLAQSRWIYSTTTSQMGSNATVPYRIPQSAQSTLNPMQQQQQQLPGYSTTPSASTAAVGGFSTQLLLQQTTTRGGSHHTSTSNTPAAVDLAIEQLQSKLMARFSQQPVLQKPNTAAGVASLDGSNHSSSRAITPRHNTNTSFTEQSNATDERIGRKSSFAAVQELLQNSNKNLH